MVAQSRAAYPPSAPRHELLGVLTAALACWLVLALAGLDSTGQPSGGGAAPLAGALGEGLATKLYQALGIASWLVPLELLLAAYRWTLGRPSLLGATTLASTLAIALAIAAMAHVLDPELSRGGVVGMILGELAQALFGRVGTFVLGGALCLSLMMLRTRLSLLRIAAAGATGLGAVLAAGGAASARVAGRGLDQLGVVWRRQRAARALAREERAAIELAAAEATAAASQGAGAAARKDATVPPPSGEAGGPRIARPRKRSLSQDTQQTADEPSAEAEDLDPAESQPLAPLAKVARASHSAGPTAADTADLAPARGSARALTGSFVLPPATLLDAPPVVVTAVDEAHLRGQAARLVDKLAAYGVTGRVDEIHPGPVVTMYEFEPESGTKVAKIASLADDLAMALAAAKVRIVAPIPGKSRVGFELPNPVREMVALRSVLETPEWDAHQGALPMALGKDIFGIPALTDLARMPHLLVAGATGAGKSVGLNVMLVSLLMRKSPAEVRTLMIDPKVVELAVFDGIPHMLLPVVTDMKKAALALRWAVDEMERRYKSFAALGVRSIATYNQRADERIPYIVVVVDEFADLMMVAAKDVESAVARLAQKARAAGIHVILATQRPSVDVITGMIKANFPTRIAFKVSQREDSKTILGRNGAEHLLGQGDMLMLPPGSSDLKRIHCAYIGEEEVAAICDHLRAQGSPTYDESILEPRDEDTLTHEGGEGGDDPLYDKAVAAVASAGFCSISHVQRQLGIGYNKAAKLVDKLEEGGIVGPPSSKAGGRREVLVGAH